MTTARLSPWEENMAPLGFVDLWRGILLCDVFNVQAKPVLRYVPVPQPLQTGEPLMYDARLCRDIAVIKGNFKYVQQKLHWESCPASIDRGIKNGWMSAIWTRPVDACSLLDDTWRTDCDMEPFRMDVKSNPDFQLLQKFQDDEGKPFKRLVVCGMSTHTQLAQRRSYCMLHGQD